MESISNRIDLWLTRLAILSIVSMLLVVPLLVDMNVLFPTGPSSKNLVLSYGAALGLFFFSLRMILFGRTLHAVPAQLALMVFAAYLIARALWDPRPDYALGVAAPHVACLFIALILSYAHVRRSELERQEQELDLARQSGLQRLDALRKRIADVTQQAAAGMGEKDALVAELEQLIGRRLPPAIGPGAAKRQGVDHGSETE